MTTGGRPPRGAQRTIARGIYAMAQEEFGRALSKSPPTRAKLRGLKRNAAVVLRAVGARRWP